jgi:hypothetical protein
LAARGLKPDISAFRLSISKRHLLLTLGLLTLGLPTRLFDRIAAAVVTLPRPLTSGAKAGGPFGKQDFNDVTEAVAYCCRTGRRLAAPIEHREP